MELSSLDATFAIMVSALSVMSIAGLAYIIIDEIGNFKIRTKREKESNKTEEKK